MMKEDLIAALVGITFFCVITIPLLFFTGYLDFGTDGGAEVPIPAYKIAEEKDVSYLNVVRLSIRVVAPSDITEQGVKDVAGDVVKKITKSQDVNAIGIFMYDRIEDAYGAYTVASVDWAPYGDWARADEVETGDYSKHQFTYEIAEK